MNVVWSFWPKPYKTQGGAAWASEKHHFLAWILTLETARRHYPRTCLYTDDAGARLLIDGLGLEFSEVSTALNALAESDPDWWVLGKIYTYGLQTEPFIHLDTDVFLWNPMPERLASAPVISQNPEYFGHDAFSYRPEAMEQALRATGAGWLPEEWYWYRSAGRAQRGDCCGVFGGNCVEFIRYYADVSRRVMEHPANQTAWSRLADKRDHVLLVEQYLLAACVEYQKSFPTAPYLGVEMRYFFNSMEKAFDRQAAAQLGFTHLLGGAKKNEDTLARLERRVQHDYPEQYKRCLAWLGGRNGRPTPVVYSAVNP